MAPIACLIAVCFAVTQIVLIPSSSFAQDLLLEIDRNRPEILLKALSQSSASPSTSVSQQKSSIDFLSNKSSIQKQSVPKNDRVANSNIQELGDGAYELTLDRELRDKIREVTALLPKNSSDEILVKVELDVIQRELMESLPNIYDVLIVIPSEGAVNRLPSYSKAFAADDEFTIVDRIYDQTEHNAANFWLDTDNDGTASNACTVYGKSK